MPYQATVYNVMIASPGDLVEERKVFREVVNEWNVLHSARRKIVLLPIGWESHSTPLMGDHPQAIINKQVLSQADLLVGAFWTRLGTPTVKALSGTVEEIEEHLATGKPTLLYFSEASIPQNIFVSDQFQALQKFKLECQSRGLYRTFKTIDDFRSQFHNHLNLLLNEDDYFKESNQGMNIQSEELTKLSHAGKELLIEAIKGDGKVMVLKAVGFFGIYAHERQFVEENNPRSRALWEGALHELIKIGFLQSVGSKDEIYIVSDQGYKEADKIELDLKSKKDNHSKLKSDLQNGDRIKLVFNNSSEEPLDLIFVNHNGVEILINKGLKPDELKEFDSFINHAWIVKKSHDNKPIIEFKPSDHYPPVPAPSN